MATLFKDGKPVEVADHDVTQALVSGQYQTDQATVHVRARDGSVYSVPTENLGKFVAGAPGARVMSATELAEHQAQKKQAAAEEKYGGLGSQAEVAAISGLSGATLGLSDVALGAVLTKEQKEELEQKKAANPMTNVGAGVVGALLPTVLSGGAAAPEEAAVLGGREAIAEGGALKSALGVGRDVLTAPTSALEHVGSVAERMVQGVVGTDADTFAGQMVQKALAKTAGGAATGAMMTAGADIGENALSPDHNLTGEQLLHHMGMGALLGGGVGLAGSLAGSGLEKLLTHNVGAEAAEGETLADKLGKTAAEWQYGATGAKTKEIRALAAHGLTPEEVGRWQLDELAGFAEDGKTPHSPEAIQSAAQNAMEDAQPKIANHIDVLDQVGAKPNWKPILDRLRGEVVSPLEQSIDPAVKGIANRVGGLVDNAEAKLGAEPSFRELYDLRREIDKNISFSKADPAQITANRELRKVRGIIEDEIGKQGEGALGEEWKTGYDAAKRQYRMAASVDEAVTSASKRMAGNNKVGLSDMIAGASTHAGLLAAGHPHALLIAGLAAVGHHLIKEYGDAVGSRLLDALSKSGALQRKLMPALAASSVQAAQKSYQTTVVRALGALTRGEMASNGPGRPKSLDSDFSEKSKVVTAALSDPGMGKAIAQQAQALGPEYATTASAYQRSALSSLVTLKAALPVEKPIDPQSPKAGTIKPSDAQKQKFVRMFDAVEDPTKLLHAAGKGLLTRDMVDAVAQAKPAILADLQKQTLAELKTLKEALDTPQMAAVKMLLGEPVFDRPVAPLAPPAPPAQPGTSHHRGGGTQRPFKGQESSATALVGSRLGS